MVASLLSFRRRWALVAAALGCASLLVAAVPGHAAPVSPRADAFYGGYRTAVAHLQHVRDVAAAHPALATVHTLGPSYLKSVGRGGHDLLAICLTEKQAGDCAMSTTTPKPKLIVVAQTHAREIITGELAWRLIDELVTSKDAAVTEILKTREVWVVPQANPDGTDIVASIPANPVPHRKNAHAVAGSEACKGTATSHAGVDLNRNGSFHWAATSADVCSQAYPGAAAASEPETVALQKLLTSIVPDVRPDDLTTAVPASTRHLLLSLHASAGTVMFPWGFTPEKNPNDAQFTALATTLAEMTKTYPGSVQGLGFSGNGATDDFAYGTLGLPSLTLEIGDEGTPEDCGGFFPVYRCADTFWNTYRPAFLHAAKVANAPFAPSA